MIERPETAVPSIAVSTVVFEIHQRAAVDTAIVLDRIISKIPFGVTYSPLVTDLYMETTAHHSPFFFFLGHLHI